MYHRNGKFARDNYFNFRKKKIWENINFIAEETPQPKAQRAAPALVEYDGQLEITDAVYTSEEEAKKHAPEASLRSFYKFIKWPANDSLWVELPKDG